MLSRAEFGSRGSCGSTVSTLLLLRVDVFADPVHAVLGGRGAERGSVSGKKGPKSSGWRGLWPPPLGSSLPQRPTWLTRAGGDLLEGRGGGAL